MHLKQKNRYVLNFGHGNAKKSVAETRSWNYCLSLLSLLTAANVPPFPSRPCAPISTWYKPRLDEVHFYRSIFISHKNIPKASRVSNLGDLLAATKKNRISHPIIQYKSPVISTSNGSRRFDIWEGFRVRKGGEFFTNPVEINRPAGGMRVSGGIWRRENGSFVRFSGPFVRSAVIAQLLKGITRQLRKYGWFGENVWR